MQHFNARTSNELWSRLSENQKRIAKDHPLAKLLPKKRSIRGVFSLICEALNNKGEDVSSIVTMPTLTSLNFGLRQVNGCTKFLQNIAQPIKHYLRICTN